MIHLSIHLFFVIAAILLTVFAPCGWNAGFIYLVSGCFLLQNAIYYVLEGRKNILRVELFFGIAFFFVNFAYPLFYYLEAPYFSLYYLPWPQLVISRATAIAYLGYAFYMLGLCPRPKKEVSFPKETKVKWTISNRQFTLFFLLMVVSFILYIAFGGLKVMKEVYSGSNASLRDSGAYSYFYILFSLASYLVAMFLFRLPRHKWWFYLGVILLILIAMLSTGSRTLALGIVLILVVGWNNHFRKFRWWEVLCVMIGGVLSLFLIVQVRQYDNNWIVAAQQIQIARITDVFKDLIINGRNLYVLVDYAIQNGYSYLHGMLLNIASILPGLSKPIMDITGDPYEVLCAQEFVNYLTLGLDSSWGLGCNMIGDAFRSFGYIGTAICMWLIGWGVRMSYNKRNENVYIYTIYYLLVSYSIFYTRGPILFPPRTLLWTLAIVWITNKIYKSQIIGQWCKKAKGLIAEKIKQ